MIRLGNDKVVDNINIYLAQYINDYFDDNDKRVYIANKDTFYAHGETIKQAIEDVIFKEQYSLGAETNAKRVVETNKVSLNDYKLLTGSCDSGVKRHLDENNIPYDTVWTIKETIDFIKKTNAYRYDVFIKNLVNVWYKYNG
jgi:hypothetical protein